MTPTHLLKNIPPEIQKRYNIAAEAKAEASDEVMGGHFEIETKDGRTVGVDAVELSGTNILVQDL